MNNYQKRRESLLAKDSKSIYVIFSNEFVTRSNDTEFPFRQDSNFYYLTGFNEPSCALVVSAKDNKTHLFLRENNPAEELWIGKRMGLKRALEELNVDETHDIKDFESKISTMLIGHENLHIDSIEQKDKSQLVQNALEKLNKSRKVPEGFPITTHSLKETMGMMRMIKDDSEIEVMRKAAKISAATHNKLIKMVKEISNEKDLHNFINYDFASNGAEHGAYANIVAGGNNANVLHYNNNDEKLGRNDLVLVDAGCEYQLYASDITRTFPASGKFSKEQKEIYQLVLDVQKKCIEMVAPGVTFKELHLYSAKELTRGLIDLGVIKGDLDTIIKEQKFKEFYPHGLGHWIGLDVHDPCPYYDSNRNETKFAAGMLLTVEPGIYLNTNNTNIPKEYRGIGIRIEDDILVTSSGRENLTFDAVKEISDIEG